MHSLLASKPRLARSLSALLSIAASCLILLSSAPAAASDQRPRQDYGTPPPATTPGEVVEWVPRVVLFPLWLLSEFVLRRPIGALVKVAERNDWPDAVVDFFTFGDRRQFTIFPSALFDFGLKPSVGFNAGWKYFLTDPNTLRAHFGTWGQDWIAARVVDTYDLSERDNVSLNGSFVRRRDLPFYGMGPRASTTRYRYQSSVGEIRLDYENRFWRSSVFRASSGVRSVVFGEGTCCDETSLDDAVRAGTLPAPPGYRQGYVGTFERLSLAVDSRKPRPHEGSGVRAEIHGEGDFVPQSENDGGRRGWIKYGASLGGAIDLTRTQRVLSLTLVGELADPIMGTIPFTDQVSLGGDLLMRGYLPNRLIDRSAAVASLRYTWPIWVFLDGVFETDVGNVFGTRFDGFDPGLFRLTSGIGVRSNGERDSGFELLVAGGTDPFEDGFHVSSFRFVLGSHHGF